MTILNIKESITMARITLLLAAIMLIMGIFCINSLFNVGSEHSMITLEALLPSKD